MKMTIERKVLIAALAIVKPAAGSSHPILQHVLVNVFEKSVECVCTNLDLTLRTRAKCESDEKVSFTVLADLLHSLVHSFSDDEIKLEIVKDRLLVACGKSKYRLGILPATDFPPAPVMRGAGEFDLPEPYLKELLSRAGFCAGADDQRVVLESTYLHVNGDLTAISTDGKRLARLTMRIPGLGKKPVELILPDYAVTELVRLLADDEEKTVTVAFLDRSAQFTFGDIVVTSKLIEGKYPKCDGVIPELGDRKPAVISRGKMLECVKRCALISDTVLLEFKKQTLNISAVADGKKIVGEASEAIPIEPGENARIKFQARYLIEALSHVEDEDIRFYGGNDEPGVFTDSSSWIGVIMPMFDHAPAPAAAAPGEKDSA